MLSILGVPKPFRGHIGVIQRNAIGSWRRLHPDVQVIIFGDEEGTAEAAQDAGADHVVDIERNEFGTPLLSAVFARGERLARRDVVCYVNCDIVLGRDFVMAVRQVRDLQRRFLMVGECRNLEVSEPLPFARSDWEERLRERALHSGAWRGQRAIDYFAFSRGLYGETPPFALGRAWFDNWLIWRAKNLGAAVIDATAVIAAIHQNHEYRHVTGGKVYTQKGVEASRNLELAGGKRHCHTIGEASHKLAAPALRRNWARLLSWEQKERAARFLWWAVEVTRPVRHALGLRLDNVRKIRAALGRSS